MRTYYPSLFRISGGLRLILLYGTTTEVHQYLPPPAAATMLVFVAVNVTNSVYIQSSTRGPLAGATSDVIQLADKGDTLILIPSKDLATWLPMNLNVIMR